jgi:hypothetical protein
MKRLAACVLLVGCIESDPPGTAPDPALGGEQPPPGEQESQVLDPTPCPATISLYGMADSGSTTFASRAYDTAGEYFCLELDARDNIWIAHFAASTPYEAGAASNFQLDLLTADGAMLREGWDVSVGQTDTRTFANVEYSIEDRVVLSAKLHVHAKMATATGSFSLSLFEPYE